ncbi:MAG: amidohydrolase [Bacteroidota bacterium]|nr:amidohydrolase [Candidatus Kapabacteria bacterium]MDW8219627.1 amidohydrolase [Bacteroidota bacterium]
MILCAHTRDSADMILYNARIYTVDRDFSCAEALAVRHGRIVAVGTSREILARWKAPQMLNLRGKYVYPGFYDAHAHLYSYGMSLQYADLRNTRSYNEVLERLKAYRRAYPHKRWIIGRGWNQNDWADKRFPTKEPLDSLFPDVPVCLTRVDGHALLANSRALALAGIDSTTRVNGGLVEKINGRLTGILLDKAMDRVYMRIPSPTPEEQEEAILMAEKRCFAVGLTSVAEAGISHELVEIYKRLYAQKRLHIRVYAMLTPTEENIERYLREGIIQTEYLSVRSFKVIADGALGSRGACLLEPYSDNPSTQGFLTIDSAWMDSFIRRISTTPFQINTHCIGDSANRLILKLYGQYIGGTEARTVQRNKRWRIEHAQIVADEDIGKFREYGIIPSVQPTHCTSDMHWAVERLGNKRITRAYRYNDLYEQRGIIAFGSDFPVEDIHPLYGFHAAVTRQDAYNKPEGGFQPDQRLTRETALRGMTIYAAFAGFEEQMKGSLEVGKLADIVVLNEDIMTIPAERLRAVQVLYTISGGTIVYKR